MKSKKSHFEKKIRKQRIPTTKISLVIDCGIQPRNEFVGLGFHFFLTLIISCGVGSLELVSPQQLLHFYGLTALPQVKNAVGKHCWRLSGHNETNTSPDDPTIGGDLEILLQSSIVLQEGRMKKENCIGKDEVKKVFKYFLYVYMLVLTKK